MDVILITNEYIYRQDQNLIFFLKPLTQSLALYFSTVPSTVIFSSKDSFLNPKVYFLEEDQLTFNIVY